MRSRQKKSKEAPSEKQSVGRSRTSGELFKWLRQWGSLDRTLKRLRRPLIKTRNIPGSVCALNNQHCPFCPRMRLDVRALFCLGSPASCIPQKSIWEGGAAAADNYRRRKQFPLLLLVLFSNTRQTSSKPSSFLLLPVETASPL